MIKDQIDHFLKLFPEMTKEEADCIEKILEWDDEKKLAFRMAKSIFEDKE